MIVRDGYRESTSKKVCVPTEKEPDNDSDMLYWILAQRVRDILGPEGGTLQGIYESVTGPMRLSLDDTREVVKEAVRRGYLR